MRYTALASLPLLLLATGGIAAGCLTTNTASTNGLDSGLPPVDGGGFGDGGGGLDATVVQQGDGGTATIDFGLIGCRTGSASRTYTFTNPGPGTVTYSASVASGSSVFAISGPSSGRVAAGTTASITITASDLPASTKAGAAVTSALVVTTNIPGVASVSVPLKVTAFGGSLSISPALAGFGQVQIGKSGSTIPLTITNSGNSPVTVTFGAPQSDAGADTEFGLVYAGSPGPTTILANGVAGAGATFLPTGLGAKAVSLAIQTNDPLCGSPASAIAMSGTGAAAQVTVGPDPLQFGTVACGQAGSTLQVLLTNASPGAISFTDSLGLGASSPFTVDVSSGSVPGQGADAGVAVINVTPKAIPVPGSIAPGAYNDTLVVTPNSPFVAPTTITLQESASGAILSLAMGGDGGTDFGTVGENQSPALPFTVTNTGNVDAPVTVSTTGAGYDAGFASSSPAAAADGGSASGNVSFVPSASGSAPGSVTVSSTAPLCAPPPTIDLTATGAIPVASFPTTPVALATTCGGGGTTQQSVAITNTGGSPLTISNVATTSTDFTIVSSPTSIAVGDSGNITLESASIGQGTAGGTVLSGTVTFTTNEPGSPTRSIPVQVTVMGANLVFGGSVSANTATIDSPSCGDVGYTVTNTGNMSATVVAGATYPNVPDSEDSELTDFQFEGSFDEPQVIDPGGVVNDVISSPLGQCAEVACTLDDSQPFTTTGNSDAGALVGICIVLPALSLVYDYCACNSKGC